MIVRELVTKLGLKLDESSIKKAETAIKDIKISLKMLSVAWVASAGSLLAMMKTTADTADAIDEASNRIGLNVKAYQELNEVAQLNNVSSENFTMSMQRLNRMIGMASNGATEAQQVFQKYGISIRNADGSLKSTSKVMDEIADRMNQIKNPAQRTAMAFQLFFTTGVGMVNMLKDGSKALEEQRKQVRELGFIFDRDAIDKAGDFGSQMMLLEWTLKGFKNEVMVGLLPALTKTSEKFLAWVAHNKKLISQRVDTFIKGLAGFVKALAFSLGYLYLFIKKIVDIFGGFVAVAKIAGFLLASFITAKIIMFVFKLIEGIKILKDAFKGLIAIEAIADVLDPFYLIAAAIVATITVLGLLLQDLYYFEKGNKSVIGTVIKLWNKWLDGLKKKEPFLASILSIVNKIASALNQTARLGKIGVHDAMSIFKIKPVLPSKKGGFLPGVSDDFISFFAPGGMVLKRAGAQNKNHIVNNVNVKIGLPPGSSEDHQKTIKKVAHDVFKEQLDKHLFSPLLTSFPRTE